MICTPLLLTLHFSLGFDLEMYTMDLNNN